MELWFEAAVAIAGIYAVALGMWPILARRSERFARRLTWVALFLFPFAGLMVAPSLDTYDVRCVRVGVSIVGGLVGGLAGAYWRSPRRGRGFADYARFILLGIVNPNLSNSPKGFSPPADVAWPREVLRLVAAVVVGIVAVIVGGRVLSVAEVARSWAVGYLVAVATFSVVMPAFGQALLAIWRMLGYRGKPIANHIWLSRTPAEFWRRWSPPAHLGFYRYVYLPCGGRTRVVWATFVAFFISGVAHEVFAGVGLLRVTGHQFAFFMLSCLGVLASPWLERLARWGLPGEVAMRLATIVFMLTTGILMFATFNNFLPMFHEPTWLAW